MEDTYIKLETLCSANQFHCHTHTKKIFWEKKKKIWKLLISEIFILYFFSFFFFYHFIDARRVVYIPSQHLLSWIINFVYVQITRPTCSNLLKLSVMGMSLAYDVYIRHDSQQVGWLGLTTKSRLFYNITQQKIQAPS